MESLVDRRHRTAQQLGDLIVGKFLPGRQSEDLLIGGPQPVGGGEHSIELGPANDLRFGFARRAGRYRLQPGFETGGAGQTPALVGGYVASDPIKP